MNNTELNSEISDLQNQQKGKEEIPEVLERLIFLFYLRRKMLIGF